MTATDGHAGKTASLHGLTSGCDSRRPMDRIRVQREKFCQLAALSYMPYLTPAERSEISELAIKNSIILAHMEHCDG
jgi:hypothetical protein